MIDFVALDFETANQRRTSVCQVGIVAFRNGSPSEKFITLVNPLESFFWANSKVHGLKSIHVAGAPTFEAIFPEIYKRLSGNIVVCHSNFDRNVLTQTTEKFGYASIKCRWLDSIDVARRTWFEFSESSCKLHLIAEALGITFTHHDAGEDAEAAGHIVARAIATTGVAARDWLAHAVRPIEHCPRIYLGGVATAAG
jgi:DNA polymerase-3 subunit epsilon